MKLVIVESPTKAKTISRFLEDESFNIESSYGHIRDLPKSKLGIDIEKNFEPQYIIPTKCRKRVNELKKLATKADEIILASDEDREGEAIAWHLIKALEIGEDKKIKRIAFHEITKSAIEAALQHPREINQNLVDAQQARRVLDRLVGYTLSPFLWKKLFKGLSAGRVQSVAVRLIVDREREIEKFIPQEYWSVIALLDKDKKEFEAKLAKKDGKSLDKFAISNLKEADEILSNLKGAEYKVGKVDRKNTKRNPNAPFTTSTLQQEASHRLGFSAKQTMMVAQQLYEQGFITYMRTDSVNISTEALKTAKETIEKNYGKEFSVPVPRKFKTKSKGAQEAHEAIRPAHPELLPQNLSEKSGKSDAKQQKLYDLIWSRFIASQMKEAIFDSTAIDIEANQYAFRANGSVIKFEGWLKIYPSKVTENILPEIKEGEILNCGKIIPSQHFTEPPPRYTEASLVKALEEHGIGRPSTYAPTISTIQTRNYVVKNDQRRLAPTETGIMVDDLLVAHFPDIVDLGFTAKVEKEFDEIAAGKTEWKPVIKNFYDPFYKNIEKKYEEVEKKETDEETDEECDKCGKPMIIKRGRFGKFMACSGFPDCKNAKSLKEDEPQSTGVKCPECGKGDIVDRKTRRGKIFYSCSCYPDCKYALWNKPTGEKCSECNSLLVEYGKDNKIKCSDKECKTNEKKKKATPKKDAKKEE